MRAVDKRRAREEIDGDIAAELDGRRCVMSCDAASHEMLKCVAIAGYCAASDRWAAVCLDWSYLRCFVGVCDPWRNAETEIDGALRYDLRDCFSQIISMRCDSWALCCE